MTTQATTEPITVPDGQSPSYYEPAALAATIATFPTIAALQYFSYRGEREAWQIVAEYADDADALDRANYAELKERLQAIDPDGIAEETHGSGLRGLYLTRLLAAPGSAALAYAAAARIYMSECYPVLNEDRWSDLEYEEANRCTRCAAVLYLSTGEYDQDAELCDRCARIARRVQASANGYRSATDGRRSRAPFSRPIRRYHRAHLTRYSGAARVTRRYLADRSPAGPMLAAFLADVRYVWR